MTCVASGSVASSLLFVSGPEVSSSRMRGQPCRVPVAGGGRDNWFNNGSGNKKREIKIIFIVLGPIMSCSFEA
jgi:hypothetical protein